MNMSMTFSPDQPSEMGSLEFVASMTDALAWPVVFAILAILFRRRIEQLLGKLMEARRFSWGDATVDFSEELDRAEIAVVELTQENKIDEQQVSPISDRFTKLLEISPSLAIADSWKPVENEMLRIGDSYGYTEHRGARFLSTLRSLRNEKKISSEMSDLIIDLNRMRNLATHGQEATKADAIRFYDLSKKVTSAMETIN